MFHLESLADLRKELKRLPVAKVTTHILCAHIIDVRFNPTDRYYYYSLFFVHKYMYISVL